MDNLEVFIMYLISKNIKVKREIFKGFGMIEIIAIALSFGLGFLLQSFAHSFQIKIFLFFICPLSIFLLLLPLLNGSTPITIFKKFLKYRHNQKDYKIRKQHY